MKTISINYLAHYQHRKVFFKYISYYLYKIKEENKKKISFIIHYTYDKEYWNNEVIKLLHEGIDAVAIQYTMGLNYMCKINTAIQSPLKYSISMDEDILLNNYALDSLIEGTEWLDLFDDILLVTPLMSIEVGSVDLFIETLCGRYKELEDLYLDVDFTDTGYDWGVNFTKLNNYTLGSSEWNYEKFYKEIENISHYYKGIHPIRVSEKAQEKVVSLILENFDEFIKKRTPHAVVLDRPYFTNHVYLLKTKVWKDLINDKSLVKDDYDEVTLNLYRRKHNMKILCLTSCLGLHCAYNTLGKEARNRVEQTLLRGLDDKIYFA